MAFCPNCGTPNTDQAEKCVSCAFELVPKQKAKFKGTIMMSGVQAPTAPAAPPGARPPQAAPAPQPAAPAPVSAPPAGGGGKNLAFEKTIMGPMAAPPVQPPPAHSPPGGFAPTAPAFGQPPGGFGGQPPQDFSRAPTVEGQAPFASPGAGFAPTTPAPAFQQPPVAQASAPAAPAGGFSGGTTAGGWGGSGSSTGGFGGGGGGGGSNTGGFGGDSMAPPVPKSNTGKILAIGCAAVVVLGCLVFGIGAFVFKNKFMDAAEGEGDALQWRQSLSQSLAQVAEICKTDCNSAAVYFHPQALDGLGEAKQLTPERIAKLGIPGFSEARMLNATDDAAIAQRFNLDSTQCVRVTAATAKVVACSVPDADPSKPASLRIVHLSGLGSL